MPNDSLRYDITITVSRYFVAKGTTTKKSRKAKFFLLLLRQGKDQFPNEILRGFWTGNINFWFNFNKQTILTMHKRHSPVSTFAYPLRLCLATFNECVHVFSVSCLTHCMPHWPWACSEITFSNPFSFLPFIFIAFLAAILLFLFIHSIGGSHVFPSKHKLQIESFLKFIFRFYIQLRLTLATVDYSCFWTSTLCRCERETLLSIFIDASWNDLRRHRHHFESIISLGKSRIRKNWNNLSVSKIEKSQYRSWRNLCH